MRESLGFILFIAFGAFPLVAAAPQPLAPHLLQKLRDKVQEVFDAKDEKKDIQFDTTSQTLSLSESASYVFPAKRQVLLTVTVENPKVVTETQYILAPPVVPYPTPIDTSCDDYENFTSESSFGYSTVTKEVSSASEIPPVTVTPTVLPSSDDFDCTSVELLPETSFCESEISSYEPKTSSYELYTPSYEPETSDSCTSEPDLPVPTTSDCSDVPYTADIYWTPSTSENLETSTFTSVLEACDSSLPITEPTFYPLLGPELLPQVRGSVDAGLLQTVKDAYSEDERVANLLACGDDTEFVFDFANPPLEAIDSSAAGTLVLADRSSFPALYDSGVSVALFELAPCALVVPHTHSRAAESIFVTDGQLHTQFVLDNNLPVVTNDLFKYQATVFPQGSFHYELNPTCEPASFISSFSSDDPGISLIAPSLFFFEDEALRATFGNAPLTAEHLESIRESIPPSVIASAQQCLARCSGSLPSTFDELNAGSATKLSRRSFDDEYLRLFSYESDSDDDFELQQDPYHSGLGSFSHDSRQYLEDHMPITHRFSPRQSYGSGRFSDRHNSLSDAQDRIRYREYVLMEISSILKDMAHNELEVTIPERRASRERIAAIAKRDLTPWDIRERLFEFLGNESDANEEIDDFPSEDFGYQRDSRISRLMSYLNGELELPGDENSLVENDADEVLQKRSESREITSGKLTSADLPQPSDAFNSVHLKQAFPADSAFPHHVPALPPGFNAGHQFQQVASQFPQGNMISGPAITYPQPAIFENVPNDPAQHVSNPGHMNQQNLPFISYQNDLPRNNEEESSSKLREFFNWIRGNNDDHQENLPIHNELLSQPYHNRPYPPPPAFPDRPLPQDRHMAGRFNAPIDRMEQRFDRERNWEKERERQREYERPPPSERFSRRPEMRFRPDIYEDDFDDDSNYYYFEDYDWSAGLSRRDVHAPSLEKTLETTEDEVPVFLDVGPVETIPLGSAGGLEVTETLGERQADSAKGTVTTTERDAFLSVNKVPRDTTDNIVLDEDESETLSWWSALWKRIFGAYPSEDSGIIEDPSLVTEVPRPLPAVTTPVFFTTTSSTMETTSLSSVAIATSHAIISPPQIPVLATSSVIAPENPKSAITPIPSAPATDSSEIIAGDDSWWAYVADSVDQLRNAVGAGRDSERWAEIKKVLDEGGLARAQEARERNDERFRSTLEKLREQFGANEIATPAEVPFV